MLLEVQCEVSTVSDDLGCHVTCWCEPKSSQLKETKDLNYFSLCALNLFNIRVSQFELNY